MIYKKNIPIVISKKGFYQARCAAVVIKWTMTVLKTIPETTKKLMQVRIKYTMSALSLSGVSF